MSQAQQNQWVMGFITKLATVMLENEEKFDIQYILSTSVADPLIGIALQLSRSTCDVLPSDSDHSNGRGTVCDDGIN